MAESTDGWLTKEEAAKALGFTTKTLEKKVKQGKLRQAMQSQINKPARAVIDPESVERMLSERSALIPTAPPPKLLANLPEVLSELFAHRSPDWPPPPFLTEAAACRYSGLGLAYLRRAVTWQRIGPRGARVCRKADIDRL